MKKHILVKIKIWRKKENDNKIYLRYTLNIIQSPLICTCLMIGSRSNEDPNLGGGCNASNTIQY